MVSAGLSNPWAAAYKNVHLFGFYSSFITLMSFILCVGVHVCHRMSVEPRGEPGEVSFPLLPRGAWELNPSHQAWPQVLIPTKSSHQPMNVYLYLWVLV